MRHSGYTDPKHYKILVIGDDSRSFLAVVRSLGQVGYRVHVLMQSQNPISSSTRYIEKSHKLTPIALAPEKWVTELTILDASEQFDLIIPCEDSALIPLMLNEHTINMKKVAYPGTQAFDVFYDKCKTLKLAEELDIPVAGIFELNTENLEKAAFPIVFKPKSSFTNENLGQKNIVTVAKDTAEADSLFKNIKNPGTFFLEQYFQGIGVGVSVLAKDGIILNAFQHERMEEGISGGSSLRRSVPLNPNMLADVKKMAEQTQLNGVAMFEFRENKQTQSYILLEVNARFWGSLPLAIYAGVDFPFLLAKQYFEDNKLNTDFSGEYSSNKVSRALTASFYSFARSISGTDESKPTVIKNLFAGLWRIIIFREKIDTFSYTDISPFWAENSALLKLVLKGFRKRTGLYKRWRAKEATKQIRYISQNKANIRSILVLCYGNICRSPFAGELLKQQLKQQGVQVSHAGFHTNTNRPSPELAQKASLDNGIDLSEHASMYANRELVQNADLIIYFDEYNYASLSTYYPEAVSKSVNLGNLLLHPKDIDDPYGHDADAFDLCYKNIKQATIQLTELLEE